TWGGRSHVHRVRACFFLCPCVGTDRTFMPLVGDTNDLEASKLAEGEALSRACYAEQRKIPLCDKTGLNSCFPFAGSWRDDRGTYIIRAVACNLAFGRRDEFHSSFTAE